MTYEGYAPHGIAIFVETMTDNTTRTVANLRSYFTKFGGSLGVNGSVEFLFDHKVVFTVTPKEEGKEYDPEELLLELIDAGAEDVSKSDDGYTVTGDFAVNGDLQSALEGMDFEIQSADFIREPKMTKEITPEEREEVNTLIDKIEDDDDVQNVFSDMAEDEE